MGNTKETKRDELAHSVGQIRSACLVVAWALEVLATDAQPPESESTRFELITGMGFILDTMVSQLGDLYGKLNEANPAC